MRGCKTAIENQVYSYVSYIAGVGFTLVVTLVRILSGPSPLLSHSPAHSLSLSLSCLSFFLLSQFLGMVFSIVLACNVSSIDSEYKMNDYT